MNKLVILRSLTDHARAYAQRHLRLATWFDDGAKFLAAIDGGQRPACAVVDGRDLSTTLNLGALVSRFGYATEVRSIP